MLADHDSITKLARFRDHFFPQVVGTITHSHRLLYCSERLSWMRKRFLGGGFFFIVCVLSSSTWETERRKDGVTIISASQRREVSGWRSLISCLTLRSADRVLVYPGLRPWDRGQQRNQNRIYICKQTLAFDPALGGSIWLIARKPEKQAKSNNKARTLLSVIIKNELLIDDFTDIRVLIIHNISSV